MIWSSKESLYLQAFRQLLMSAEFSSIIKCNRLIEVGFYWLVQGLEVTRITATRYLDEMIRIGLMSKQKLVRDNYYINIALFNLLINAHKK